MNYHEIRTLLKAHFTDLLKKHKASIAVTGRLSERDLSVFRSRIEVAGSPDMFNLTAEDEIPPVDRLIALYGLTALRGTFFKQLLTTYSF